MANQMTKKPSENTYIGLGLSLGMVFGLTVGQLLFDNAALGLALGLSMGVAIGAGMWDSAKKKWNQQQHPDDPVGKKKR